MSALTGWPSAPGLRARRAHIGGLLVIALLVPLHWIWAAQAVLVVLLLVVPGAILLRACGVPQRVVRSFPIYVPTASIALMSASGLLIDLLGPLVGISRPLRVIPLLATLELLCAILLVVRADGRVLPTTSWKLPQRYELLAVPFLLPVIAVIGALRLNQHHGNGVALLAVVSCVGVLATLLVVATRIHDAMLAATLYATGLAMMWSYSLRSGVVYGFDIATEYQRLNQTITDGLWHTSHVGDAYGAMLSVTVFPAEFHLLSGVSLTVLLEVVYPAIGALFPVAVYDLSRRLLGRPWAFAAGFLTIAQASFAQELPGLARQEIGLVLFTALLAAALDAGRRQGVMPERRQWLLVAIFGVAMAVSHYSTTYLAIIVMAMALLLQFVTSWFRGSLLLKSGVAVALVAALAGAVAWYGAITASASALASVAKTVASSAPEAVAGGQAGGPLGALLGASPTSMSAGDYQQLVSVEYANNTKGIVSLGNSLAPQYALRSAAVPERRVAWPVGLKLVNWTAFFTQEAINIVAAISCSLMVIRRRGSSLISQIGMIGVGALLMLFAMKLIPALSLAYNQERALLQMLPVLAPACCWFVLFLTGRAASRQTATLVVMAVVLAVLCLSVRGAFSAVLGGGTAVNLANSGEDYERFYMTEPEIAAALWLGRHESTDQYVYADRYAELRLAVVGEVTGRTITDVTPASINRSAWVYASRTNIIDGRARAFYDGEYVIYSFPINFLTENFDLVYTNGTSEVYYR